MATTKEEIKDWLQQGIKEKSTHVIIVCDTFAWEDYPVFVKNGENVKDKYSQYNGVNMQKVMEVYNLSIDIDKQLKENRSFNF